MNPNIGGGPGDDSARPPKKKSSLPEDLRFLVELPDFKNMDAQEFLKFAREHHAKLCAARAALVRHGVDADVLIADMGAKLKNCEKTSMNADTAVEKMLQATADLADAERNMFKAAVPLVEAAYAERPFDSPVQEWKEFLDEWRKQMPKEE